jgi:hypothetical protein
MYKKKPKKRYLLRVDCFAANIIDFPANNMVFGARWRLYNALAIP